jgi:hypothetical protein
MNTDTSTWYKSRRSGGYGPGGGGEPFEVGAPERMTVIAGRDQPPVPTDAPGYRRPDGDASSAVSAIFVPVSATETTHSGDDELGGDDVDLYEARVRVATPEEAAPLLAQEAVTERRADLARRVDLHLTNHSGCTDAAISNVEEIPNTATIVPIGTYRYASTAEYPRVARLESSYWVDRDAGLVWSFPAGTPTVWAMPLTPDRARLVDELEAEYGRTAR